MVKEISAELAEHVYNGGFIACKHIHDNSCEWTALIKLWTIFNKAYKFYIPLHVVPVLLFKRHRLRQEPTKTIKQTVKNIMMSSLFLSTYVAVFRYLLCVFKNARGKVDRWNLVGAAFFCGFAVIFENEPRRNELALYLLPRAFEALWNYGVKQGKLRNHKNGEVLVFAICMSFIMYCYQNAQEHIKPAYLSMFRKFWGDN